MRAGSTPTAPACSATHATARRTSATASSHSGRRGEAVVDVEHVVTEVVQPAVPLGRLVAAAARPATAVDLHDRRHRLAARHRTSAARRPPVE